jgi:hypothetical protein
VHAVGTDGARQRRVVLDQEGDAALLRRRTDRRGERAQRLGLKAMAAQPQAGDVAGGKRRPQLRQGQPGLATEGEPGRGDQVEPAGWRVDVAQRGAC